MEEDKSSPTTIEYAVRIPASFVSNMRESSVMQPTPLRNLHKDFLDLNEEMQVYVRVKPCQEASGILTITNNHILVNPSKDSVSFKNRSNFGATKALQKFKFNKIYEAGTNQEQLFKDSALNMVQDFLLNQNTLIFTYGATSAGKTYTMLGTVGNAGLIPRSLDVMFNSLEGRLLSSPLLKPLALNEIMKLNAQQIEAEEMEHSIIMKGFDLDQTKDSISSVSNSSLKDWDNRDRDTTVCQLQHQENYYSVWVSYCEIYNEQVFDLLDSCDRRKKRSPLRVTEDRKGKFYVKGLKEICVHSADDAVRVLLFGKENLHFAATKLNHNSSRSHCVFTVKIIRTDNQECPTEAAVNMMSFCDLAGMERTTKTQSRGERLKEAGNINTSLLVLGRCIDTMRSNQQNLPSNKMMIPYRESKLTRILQTFFSGQGRAAMFVNVSPSAILCDETLHVLKFAALAQEVIIQPLDKDSSMADCSMMSQFAPPVRPSRFQQYVRKSISILSARGPSVLEQSTFQTIGEEDVEERIRRLEADLIRTKSECEENEQKIRDECCNEWSMVVTKMESSWNQRYEDLKERYEEFCENRVNLMSNYMSQCMKKRKMDRSSHPSQPDELERASFELKEKDDRINALEESNQQLNEMIVKLKNSLKVSEEGKADLQQEMTRLQFETASILKPKMNFCGSELEDEFSEQPVIDEHQANMIKKLQQKLVDKEEMLNEAVIEFHNKNQVASQLQVENDLLKKQVQQMNSDIVDLKSQLEKSNLLLSDANERLDVREEELMNLEEKLMKANGQYGNINTELREARRKLRGYENKDLKDHNVSAVQNMCEELQIQLLKSETLLDQRQEEIVRLNSMLKQLKSSARVQQEDAAQMEMIKDHNSKLQIQLGIVNKEMMSFKMTNEDLKAQHENLLDEVSHLKKDLELLSSERRQEETHMAELVQKGELLQLANNELRDSLKQLTGENNEFQKTMVEYESTIKELTILVEQMRIKERSQSLVEEELTILAATLGRLQLEKNQLEKEHVMKKSDLEKLERDLLSIQEDNIQLQQQLEKSQRRNVALEDELKSYKLADGLVDSEKQEQLVLAEKRLVELEKMIQDKNRTESQWMEKFDGMEANNEKLNKEMLKHMRRADQLSETVNKLKEALSIKSEKCESLLNRIKDLELQRDDVSDIKSLLAEKECALRDKENHTLSILATLENKQVTIKEMIDQKEQDQQLLKDKNLEILRLEMELKSILSGHVNYKKTEKPAIKIEKSIDEETGEQPREEVTATPTPVRARRGRAKKASPPGSALKELESDRDAEFGQPSSCTRSRRTLRSDCAVAPPASSSKTSGRKSRKPPKMEEEVVAHPALSVKMPQMNFSEEEQAIAATTSNTKRRLYNSKYPDILLPSTNNEESELDTNFKRVATRASRKT